MVHKELKGGFIFDIQGFSVHDGPGCRTLIFFKGCSLDCPWCSNPEGLRPFPEPLWKKNRCTFDLLCMEACRYKAISVIADHSLVLDRGLCSVCTSYDCAQACCSGALQIGGYFITIDQLIQTIQRDRRYWGSNCGITLTGGEPFLQPEFARYILRHCFESYIHTAAETCGNYPWNNIEDSLPYLEWIFYDLKLCTGSHTINNIFTSSNPQILSNASRLAKEFNGRIIFRLPLIPGINDDQANLEATREFILSTGRNELNILPGHHLGREKYQLVGKPYYTTEYLVPTHELLLSVRDLFEQSGIRCYIGSETPF